MNKKEDNQGKNEQKDQDKDDNNNKKRTNKQRRRQGQHGNQNQDKGDQRGQGHDGCMIHSTKTINMIVRDVFKSKGEVTSFFQKPSWHQWYSP